MALISMRQLLDHAAEHGYGVPAYNVNNLEQMRAIMESADQTKFSRICISVTKAVSWTRESIRVGFIPGCNFAQYGDLPALCQ